MPVARGLYDPQWEHDACGIGAIVDISGRRNHAIVEYGRQVLLNLMHRGTSGADESTGDGAGILLQIPDEFLRTEAESLGFSLPPQGHYGVGMFFLPRDSELRGRCGQILAAQAEAEGLTVLGWHDVPSRQPLPGRTRPNVRTRHSPSVLRWPGLQRRRPGATALRHSQAQRTPRA